MSLKTLIPLRYLMVSVERMKYPNLFFLLTILFLAAGCVLSTPSYLPSPPTEGADVPQALTLETISPMTSQPSLALKTSTIETISFKFLGVPGEYNPTQSHWSLWDLQRWHNRLYLAHGDWFNNTGPVRVLYLDLETDTLTHDEGFILDEEAIEIYRLYNDTLYIPGADSTEGWEFGNLYHKPWGESWTKFRSIPSSIHTWDIALLGDTLVAAGRIEVSGKSSGAIWTSSDNGQSWDWGPNFTESGYAEATSLFVLGDLLYATTVGTGCLVYDGNQWSEIECIISDIFVGTAHVHKSTIFENSVAMVPHSCVTDTHLYLFDGESHWRVDLGQPIHDAVSTDIGLFVLGGIATGAGTIFHASNLTCHCEQDFQRIIEFNLDYLESTQVDALASSCSEGSTPLSLEYVQERFYIGLADGRLFRSQPYHP